MRTKRLAIATAALLCGCGGSTQASGGESGGGILTATDSGVSGQGTDSQAAGSDSGSATEGSQSGADGTKFDVGIPDASTACGGAGGAATPDFSYIWVANSPQGTVSKINTQTLVEEGRYAVRSDSAGSPSRTSVNLNGDVAVANRSGGVTMIRARLQDCPNPANTSSGAGDIKAWQDGCIAWHTPFNYASQRPVAWTQGTFDTGTCRYEDVKLWTSGASGSIDVILMDGETGIVEQVVPIPGVTPNFFGIYGAAVDSDGNFWGSQLSIGQIVRVRLNDFSVSTWPMDITGYGMTVDPQGRLWTCSSGVARFDPVTETWANNSGLGASGGGCMADATGTLWVAGSGNQLFGVNTETLVLEQQFAIPGYGKGISIDFEGNIWAVSTGADAYRVDPNTGTVDTFTGLNSPYTYSDMTGFALSNAGGPAG